MAYTIYIAVRSGSRSLELTLIARSGARSSSPGPDRMVAIPSAACLRSFSLIIDYRHRPHQAVPTFSAWHSGAHSGRWGRSPAGRISLAADEIATGGPSVAGDAQLSQVGSLVGIPLSIALAGGYLQLPLWVSGAGFWGLAGLLLLTMPEQGYRPGAWAQRHAWQGMRATLHAGLHTVRGHATLLSVLVITMLYGMSSEALSRLTPLHLLDEIGLSSRFTEATWFGLLHAGASLGGAVVTWLLSQTTALRHPRRIVQLLLALTTVMLATLLFALADVCGSPEAPSG